MKNVLTPKRISQAWLLIITIGIMSFSNLNAQDKTKCSLLHDYELITFTAVANDSCCIDVTVGIPPASYMHTFTVIVNGDTISTAYGVADTIAPIVYCPPEGALGQSSYSAIFTAICNDCGTPKVDTLIIDLSACEVDCCPPEKDSWLSFEVEYNSLDCGSAQCAVRPVINIPQDVSDSCFAYFNWRQVPGGDFEQQNIAISGSMPIKCLDEGETVDIELVLLAESTDDPSMPRFESCTINGSAGPCESDKGKPCYPDDYGDEYNDFEGFGFPMDALSNCPGCSVHVDYTWRMAGPYQEVQITGISFPDGAPCDGCTIDDIYAAALPQAMLRCINKHNFLPNEADSVNSQWRVAQAGCWGWGLVFGSLWELPYMGWIPCGCDTCGCCLQRYEVEMTDEIPQTIKITPIGIPVVFNTQCDSLYIVDWWTWPPRLNPCQAACEWPGLVNGEYVAKPWWNIIGTNGKIRTDEIIHKMTSVLINDVLEVELHSKMAENAILTIYDLDGTEIGHKEYPAHTGLNYFSYDVSNLRSGAYIYTVTINDGTIFTHKFMIVR